MRKSLMSRILLLTAAYCVVFCALVFIQFFGKGNFTITANGMTIKGQWLEPDEQFVKGGIKIFYNGLELNLKDDISGGMAITNYEGIVTALNPLYLTMHESKAEIGLPGGTVLIFNSIDTSRGPELQISAGFPEDVSMVSIPVTHRRSSLIQEDGQFGILYGGERYFLSRSGNVAASNGNGTANNALENSYLVLAPDSNYVSYRTRSKQREFDPGDFIIAQSEYYQDELTAWRNSSYAQWNRTASILNNENDITAFLSESLQRGNFPAAVNAISSDFTGSRMNSYKTAVFLGGITDAYRQFNEAEREKTNLYTRLIRERSAEIFLAEEHILDFLYSRNNITAAHDLFDMLGDLEPENISIDHCPGILEIYSDSTLWHSTEANQDNFTEKYMEQILLLISENIYHDEENDLVFILNKDSKYNLRLGKSLLFWAESQENAGYEKWADISRSLILSALTNGGSGNGELYNSMVMGDYYPRASELATPAGIPALSGTNLWAWTVSPSIRATNAAGDLNIAVSFPANLSHYLIIRGVRPFIRIQIHGMDWRSDSQFERYDSSGWVYYPADQTIVFKLRHRTATENIRIIYRIEEPPPPPPPPQEPDEQSTNEAASPPAGSPPAGSPPANIPPAYNQNVNPYQSAGGTFAPYNY